MTASVLCSVIIFAANYSFKEKPPGLDFPLLLVDEYISNYIFLILKMKNMNSMNGTFMGIANSQKNPRFDQETIQAGQCIISTGICVNFFLDQVIDMYTCINFPSH